MEREIKSEIKSSKITDHQVNSKSNVNTKTTYKFRHIQKPGELIFVPSQCRHRVRNRDFTVAVTHNFVHESNFYYFSEIVLEALERICTGICTGAASLADTSSIPIPFS